MDLSMLEAMIPDIAGWLNIEPATLLLYMMLICTAANIVSRVIPDDVGGFWGQVRRICTIIGAYTPNRVTRGISVNDVARSIVAPAIDEVIEAASDPDSLIPEVERSSTGGYRGSPGNTKPFEGPVVPAFPGLAETDRRGRDAATGKFASRSKGESDET
jgi:hypothetical protein